MLGVGAVGGGIAPPHPGLLPRGEGADSPLLVRLNESIRFMAPAFKKPERRKRRTGRARGNAERSTADLTAERNNFRHRVNQLRLVLNPRARSASLGTESVGTTSGNGGIALFHPNRARTALVSFRGT